MGLFESFFGIGNEPLQHTGKCAMCGEEYIYNARNEAELAEIQKGCLGMCQECNDEAAGYVNSGQMTLDEWRAHAKKQQNSGFHSNGGGGFLSWLLGI